MKGARPKGRRSSPKAGVGAASGVDGNGPKRFSVQRKIAIVARLLRGEPLDLVARQTNEIARLKSKVGEITMDNELLNAKIAALEGKRPLAHRRSRR